MFNIMAIVVYRLLP